MRRSVNLLLCSWSMETPCWPVKGSDIHASQSVVEQDTLQQDSRPQPTESHNPLSSSLYHRKESTADESNAATAFQPFHRLAGEPVYTGVGGGRVETSAGLSYHLHGEDHHTAWWGKGGWGWSCHGMPPAVKSDDELFRPLVTQHRLNSNLPRLEPTHPADSRLPQKKTDELDRAYHRQSETELCRPKSDESDSCGSLKPNTLANTKPPPLLRLATTTHPEDNAVDLQKSNQVHSRAYPRSVAGQGSTTSPMEELPRTKDEADIQSQHRLGSCTVGGWSATGSIEEPAAVDYSAFM